MPKYHCLCQDSLRISPREARSLIEQAEKRQKDAQNTDKKAADMLAEYERRKGILDTRLSELEKNGGAALAVLDAQQARLLGQQTRNDRAISEARNKLSSVTESLNCVFRSIRSRIGIEVRSAIRIHSINRELNFFYRF
ncbi:hypothetical protein U4Z62_23345, partial [Escherichia coli]|nr:hypothetical protein [Escherichia coli]